MKIEVRIALATIITAYGATFVPALTSRDGPWLPLWLALGAIVSVGLFAVLGLFRLWRWAIGEEE